MKKKWNYLSGIDVSKKTFDIALGVNEANSNVVKTRFANKESGYEKLGKWLKDQGINCTELLVCLEHMGIYHRLLCRYLKSQGCTVWEESPVQIKWSLGLQRGKSDPADAERILKYAYRNQDKTKPYTEQRQSLQQIADYLSLRSRLQTCISQLKVPVKEFKHAGLADAAKNCEQACSASIQALTKELKELDDKILAIINADEELYEKYKYATSVRCVGFVAATHLLVYTHGFTRFDNVKQLASYAGVAPFEYSSGSSIRGRTKVHPMANKTLKTVLHMCAVSSVRHNPEMRAYFARKVGQGKNKMLVLNAVRNKVLSRVFSCVKNQRMYTENYAA